MIKRSDLRAETKTDIRYESRSADPYFRNHLLNQRNQIQVHWFKIRYATAESKRLINRLSNWLISSSIRDILQV